MKLPMQKTISVPTTISEQKTSEIFDTTVNTKLSKIEQQKLDLVITAVGATKFLLYHCSNNQIRLQPLLVP